MKTTKTISINMTTQYKKIAVSLNKIDLAIDGAALEFAAAWDRTVDGKSSEVEVATSVIEGSIVAFYSEYSVRCNLSSLAMACAAHGMDYPSFTKACKAVVGTVDKDNVKHANFAEIAPWTNASYSQQARGQFDKEKQGANVGRGGGAKKKMTDFAKAKKLLSEGDFTQKQVESLVLLLSKPATVTAG